MIKLGEKINRKCKLCDTRFEIYIKGYRERPNKGLEKQYNYANHKSCNSRNICYLCQKEKRRAADNLETRRKYGKTRRGFLINCYCAMKRRVNGKGKLFKYWSGKPIVEKAIFIKWSINNKKFNTLFAQYKKYNYQRKFCPTVDRLDSNNGYVFGNMEWVTQQENSRRASKDRRK
jgi:hypothetical protein